MTTQPVAKFKVGDIVKAAVVYPGQVPSPQEYKILAVYRNTLGFWYAAQTVGGTRPGDQDTLSGEHYEKVSGP